MIQEFFLENWPYVLMIVFAVTGIITFFRLPSD